MCDKDCSVRSVLQRSVHLVSALFYVRLTYYGMWTVSWAISSMLGLGKGYDPKESMDACFNACVSLSIQYTIECGLALIGFCPFHEFTVQMFLTHHLPIGAVSCVPSACIVAFPEAMRMVTQSVPAIALFVGSLSAIHYNEVTWAFQSLLPETMPKQPRYRFARAILSAQVRSCSLVGCSVADVWGLYAFATHGFGAGQQAVCSVAFALVFLVHIVFGVVYTVPMLGKVCKLLSGKGGDGY